MMGGAGFCTEGGCTGRGVAGETAAAGEGEDEGEEEGKGGEGETSLGES
jgi:hypothetical protein